MPRGYLGPQPPRQAFAMPLLCLSGHYMVCMATCCAKYGMLRQSPQSHRLSSSDCLRPAVRPTSGEAQPPAHRGASDRERLLQQSGPALRGGRGVHGRGQLPVARRGISLLDVAGVVHSFVFSMFM